MESIYCCGAISCHHGNEYEYFCCRSPVHCCRFGNFLKIGFVGSHSKLAYRDRHLIAIGTIIRFDWPKIFFMWWFNYIFCRWFNVWIFKFYWVSSRLKSNYGCWWGNGPGCRYGYCSISFPK